MWIFETLRVGIWHTSDLELETENLQSLLSISYSNVQYFFKDIQKSVLNIFKNNTGQTTSTYMFIELAPPRQGE